MTDMTAAIQNDRTRALTPAEIPRNQPIPRVSFASPSPIQRPLETIQIKANGDASNGPARNAEMFGTWNHDAPPIHKFIRESNINVYENWSGMILCLIS